MYLLLLMFIFALEVTVTICAPKCEDFATCSTCVLNTFDDCLWCSTEIHKGKRCQRRKQINDTWCTNIIRKSEIKLDITKDDEWNTGDNGKKMVQFRPQNATIKFAVPGASVDIRMSYIPAKDAPLDIYFLVDNSGNIASYKKSLISQTRKIFQETKNYTNNVRLGIGTFVEKPSLPYANPDDSTVYTFQNHLSLTNDSDIFINTLKSIKAASNYDKPEDLLDGLMNAMLCKKLLDWRENSRKIIVTFTDAFYHAAGDGKMVGAFKRHDMKCHDNDGMDIILDYPSIAQVNKVAKENGYVLIFAYTNDVNSSYVVKDYYKLLSEKIYGSKYDKLMDENIARIIKDEYSKIIEDVKIEHDSSLNVQVNIKKECADCKAMHSNPLEFVATIKVMSCNELSKGKEIITIKPMSLNEELRVEIEFQCQCDCEKTNSAEMNMVKCKGQGEYQCGVCKCNPDRYGDDCACISDSINTRDDYEKCRKNPNDALRCSGHGECSCGTCECHNGFSGPFCEFDENACPRPGGKMCSGHGSCRMGICQCDPNWTHSLNGIDDCGCPLEQRSCVAPYSNKICSGNGECICGECQCTNNNTIENTKDVCKGRFCDKCSWFTEKRCEELEDYAYCRFLNHTSCQDNNNLTSAIVVFANRSEINSPDNIDWYRANLCRVKKENNDSIFVFKYYYTSEPTEVVIGGATDDAKLVLLIQSELDEVAPADIWVPVGSAIGGILLIGLLSLLLWKVLTDMYDAREYHQFEEKARAAGFNVNMTENPWYEPPTTTFINPTHKPK